MIMFSYEPRMLSLSMIWEGARHNAFTDLACHGGRWYCAFREGAGHALSVGRIRVLVSEDGLKWESAALIALRGVDLRDPKLSRAADGNLELLMGASPIREGRYTGRSTLASRSPDGSSWSPPSPVVGEGDWLWRVARRGKKSYGISYRLPSPRRWIVALLRSDDGLTYREFAQLGVPGKPNEATLRFRGPEAEAIALVRREAGNSRAWIGRSLPPYIDWSWCEAAERVGGPNFIVLPGGSLVAATRILRRGKPLVALCSMTEDSLTPILTLPSGGDCGYPGMVFHRDRLWMSYYSSHEGKARIYLATIDLAGLSPGSA